MKNGINLYTPEEDYTESVCLLLPKGCATLVDLDFYEWAAPINWRVLGRTIFTSRYWPGTKAVNLRVSRLFLHRMAFTFALDGITRWNLRNRLLREHIDHVNRNPWDNRRKNLRLATPSQNAMNRPGLSGTSSKYKGVFCNQGKRKVSWTASATVNGKTWRLGTFDNELDAAMAYNRFVAEKCGEFAYLNPITVSGDAPAGKPPRSRRRRVKRSDH